MSDREAGQIIVVTAEKGGVGKTTTAVHVGAALARGGASVLLVDADQQGSVATALGLEAEPGIFNALVVQMSPAQCIRQTGRENLYLLPGNQKTKTAATIISTQIASRELELWDVGEMLQRLGRAYEYMVIDTPANSVLQEAALSVADVVLIPAALDFLAMTGVAKTLENIKKLCVEAPRILIVPTLYDKRLGEHTYNLGTLQATYPEQVTGPIVSRATMRSCAAYGQTIFEYDPVCLAGEGYETLALQIHRGSTTEQGEAEHAHVYN